MCESNSFDSIFHSKSTRCDDKSCDCKIRLLYGLKYYQMLNVEDENDANTLVKFYKETYPELLNDFIHLIVKHKHELDDIYDDMINNNSSGLKKCDISNCKRSARYSRDRRIVKTVTTEEKINNPDSKCKDNEFDPNEELRKVIRSECKKCNSNEEENDSEDSDNWAIYDSQIQTIICTCPDDDEIFYDVDEKSDAELEFILIRDLFDAIHCYILHQYDFGYRTHKQEKESIVNQENDACAVIMKIIKNKKNKLRDISQFMNTNKFTLKYTENNIKNQKPTNYNGLFIDGVYKQLQCSIDSNNIIQVAKFLTQQEYDSDALKIDIRLNLSGNNCNLKNRLSRNVFSAIRYYYMECNVSRRLFSTGFIFYYWDYYKQKQQENVEEQIEETYNINDHGGYKPHALYVTTKYTDIKSEILHNTIHTLNIAQFRISLAKANKFMETIRTRQMKATEFTYNTLKYGIPPGRIPKVSHLLAILLYTDWSDLCMKFSGTFRKIDVAETIISVIKRNQEYANWSRLLRETVEGYGDFGNDLTGHFFCGMSIVMVMPEMNIRLCGPTSTSKQIEVALRFSGDHEEGMIIQLKNYSAEYGMQVSGFVHLRGFQCTWLSNYNGEDEYLFLGGYQKIAISTIKHLSTKRDFGAFVKPLFFFGCITNGTRIINPDIDDKDISILETLVESEVNNDRYVHQFPEYINYTFLKLINAKRTLIFNIFQINRWMNDIGSILFTKFNVGNVYDNITNKDNCNLLKPTVFKLFKNVDKIVIYSNRATGSREWMYYPFKLELLLSILVKSNVSTGFMIVIKAIWHESRLQTIDGHSWLEDEFNDNVEAMYNHEKWKIKLIGTKNNSGKNEDCIVMTKL